MPYDDPDPTDPQVLVGVALPSSEEATREMVYVYAEEFARMGMDAHGVLSLFTNPFYTGAHQIYQALGADAVQGIVEECVAVWGRSATRIHDAPGVFPDNRKMVEPDGPLVANDK